MAFMSRATAREPAAPADREWIVDCFAGAGGASLGIEAALRVLPVEDLYHEHRDALQKTMEPAPSVGAVSDRHVARALSYLVVSWQGLNGTAGTRNYNQQWSVRWSASGGRWGWARVPETIPWWHQRLRTVTVLCRDAFGLLPLVVDQPGTAIYLDPPYIAKSDKYLHDFTDQDHARLAAQLARFRRARVVVSYYDHPEVRRLYAGWTIRPISSARKNLVHSARNGKLGREVAPEVLIMNGPSLVQASLLETAHADR
jgi:DNA adenine methylase